MPHVLTEKQKERKRETNRLRAQRPEVKARIHAHVREWQSRPEIQARIKERRQHPDVRMRENKRRSVALLTETPEAREVRLLRRRNDYHSKWKSRVSAYSKRADVKERIRRRRASDPNFRLRMVLRARLNHAVNAIANGIKAGSAVRDLGCTIDELREHLAFRFTEGMTWSNHGAWHIDHIIPLASFDLTNREHFLKAVHYTNLQPLWAEDNWRKNDRVIEVNMLP